MTEIDKQIIKFLDENKGIKEITNILNISEKQFYISIKRLINYGYQLKPSYNYNSDIYYKIVKDEYEDEKNKISIKVSNSINPFRCLVISDTHIGNVDSDMTLLNKVYEYATKENISVILNCGDLIEGAYSTDRKNLKNAYDQLNYFVKNHPYDKNIRVYTILGNHDYHSLHYDGLSVSKFINNARYDIIPIGNGKGIVNIKNDNILLEHELSIIDNPEVTTKSNLILVGHGHMMKTKYYDKLYLLIPTLSYVSPDKTKELLPGFVDLKINLKHNMFDFLEAKHIIMIPDMYEASVSK